MSRPKRARLTEEGARAEMLAHGAEMIGHYIGTTQKPQPMRCLTCGHEGSVRINDLRHGRGPCVMCGRAQSGRTRRITDEEAREEFLKYGVIIKGQYVGLARTPQPGWCDRCGSEVSPSLGNLRFSSGPCRKCGDERSAKARAQTEEAARAELLSYGLEMLGPYNGSTQRGQRCRCVVCLREVAPHITSLRQGTGPCKHCAYDSHPGGTNWTTLSRDPEWAASDAVLYVALAVLPGGRTVPKVGISTPGNRRPFSYGDPAPYVSEPMPRAVAYWREQAILERYQGEPIPAEGWPYSGGRTEVLEMGQ